MDVKAVIETLIKRWRDECDEINEDLIVLRKAKTIMGDETLKQGIVLRQAKVICLRKCAMELNGATAGLF